MVQPFPVSKKLQGIGCFILAEDVNEAEEFEDEWDEETGTSEPPGVSMATRNGCLVNLIRPTADWVDPESVARTLCNINRYAGNYGEYSVAQHSVVVSMVVELLKGDHIDQLGGLWHDASESVTNDIPRPVKVAIDYFGGGFSEIENRLNECINKTWLVDVDHPLVRRADMTVFTNEVLRLVPREYRKLYVPLPDAEKLLPYNLLVPWGKEVAYHRFMDRHETLVDRVGRMWAREAKESGNRA